MTLFYLKFYVYKEKKHELIINDTKDMCNSPFFTALNKLWYTKDRISKVNIGKIDITHIFTYVFDILN